MVGRRIAFGPLLRVLRGARKVNMWADLRFLLKDRLVVRRKAARNQDPLPPVLFQMATGYWVSQAIYVAAKLGIADLLENGPQSSVELAAATCCDSLSLLRVLRALANIGVLSQIEKERFALARLGNALRSNVPGSLRRILITLGEIHYRACGELLHTVRTGSPAFDRAFEARLFEYLQRNPDAGVAFNRGMTDVARLLVWAVLLAYDFSGVSTIVDVGGGEGTFLGSILNLYPDMTGIVFDSSSEIYLAACPTYKEDRCAFISGNFFDSVPERAEAYLLCGVLHDWSDEFAAAILRNCRKVIAKNGRLLIVETIVPETNSVSFSKLLDINMMVMTSGRERTQTEFRDLLDAADFTVTRTIPTLAPQSIIEARPK